MRPTAPMADPLIAAASAFIGTVPYSPLCPVICEICWPRTMFNVSRNRTGNTSVSMSVTGSRDHRTSIRLVCTTVCGTSTRKEFSGRGRAVAHDGGALVHHGRHQDRLDKTIDDAGTRSNAKPANHASVGAMIDQVTDPADGVVSPAKVRNAHHKLGNRLVAHNGLDPMGKLLYGLNTDGKQTENQRGQNQQWHHRLRVSAAGADQVRGERQQHPDHDHQHAKSNDVFGATVEPEPDHMAADHRHRQRDRTPVHRGGDAGSHRRQRGDRHGPEPAIDPLPRVGRRPKGCRNGGKHDRLQGDQRHDVLRVAAADGLGGSGHDLAQRDVEAGRENHRGRDRDGQLTVAQGRLDKTCGEHPPLGTRRRVWPYGTRGGHETTPAADGLPLRSSV